jgi:hypothetical protein
VPLSSFAPLSGILQGLNQAQNYQYNQIALQNALQQQQANALAGNALTQWANLPQQTPLPFQPIQPQQPAPQQPLQPLTSPQQPQAPAPVAAGGPLPGFQLPQMPSFPPMYGMTDPSLGFAANPPSGYGPAGGMPSGGPSTLPGLDGTTYGVGGPLGPSGLGMPSALSGLQQQGFGGTPTGLSQEPQIGGQSLPSPLPGLDGTTFGVGGALGVLPPQQAAGGGGGLSPLLASLQQPVAGGGPPQNLYSADPLTGQIVPQTGFQPGQLQAPAAVGDPGTGGGAPQLPGYAAPPQTAAGQPQQMQLPNIVSQLESGGGRDVASQPAGMADPTYGQYPDFSKDYGSGAAGVTNFANQVLAAKPNATLGDFYADYVLGTGKPGQYSAQDLAATTKPGAQGAYRNLVNNSGVPVNTPLASLMGGPAQGGGRQPSVHPAVQQTLVTNNVLQKRQGEPAPAVDAASQTASSAAQDIDPSQWGRSRVRELIQAIDKANPKADPGVKFLALKQLNALLAPDDKMMLQYVLAQHRDDLSIWRTQYTQQAATDRALQSQQAALERLQQTQADITKRQEASQQAALERQHQIQADITKRQEARQAAIDKRWTGSLAERQREFDQRMANTGVKGTPQEQAQLRLLRQQRQALNTRAAQQGGWIAADDDLKSRMDDLDQQADDILTGIDQRSGGPVVRPRAKPAPASAFGPGGAAIPPATQ